MKKLDNENMEDTTIINEELSPEIIEQAKKLVSSTKELEEINAEFTAFMNQIEAKGFQLGVKLSYSIIRK